MSDKLGDAVADLLRRVSDDWAEVPEDAPEDTLAAITGAGFVVRRVYFTFKLPGCDDTQRVVIEATGEDGLSEAMDAVIQDVWAKHGGRLQELREEIGEPIKPIINRERDEWRLTDCGRQARAELEHGDRTSIDFALKRGFFDGKDRMLPDGRIVRRLPVRGYGRLVKVENAPSGPLAVSVTNWAEGAEAFAAATPKPKTSGKKKKTQGKSGSAVAIGSALATHHKYDNGSCGNYEPISGVDLANLAGVKPPSVSRFMQRHFGGQKGYKAACQLRTKLDVTLMVIRGDTSRLKTYGRTPPGEGRDE